MACPDNRGKLKLMSGWLAVLAFAAISLRSSTSGWGRRGQSVNVATFPMSPGDSVASPPAGVERASTIHARCHCGTGMESVTVWPNDNQSASVTVQKGEVRWVHWGKQVSRVSFFCNAMGAYEEVEVDVQADQWFSVKLMDGDIYSAIGDCVGRESGYLHMNTWSSTAFTSSIPFTSGTEGYACFKIPTLLRTQSGALIAFAEARGPTCSDFATTDSVYKRSTDGGRTWSPLQVLVNVSAADRLALGLCGKPLVIGNIAPVQLRADSSSHPGRILVPYTRNNFKVWLVHSDDDGVTWKGDHEVENMTVTESGVPYAHAQPDCDRGMSYFGFDIDFWDDMNLWHSLSWFGHLCFATRDPFEHPTFASKLVGPWQWVGIGPSNSLQLSDGRVLVPGYHSFVRGLEGEGASVVSQLYNNFALGHTMISDDGGDTWRLSDDFGRGHGANENQMLELASGEILMDSRSLSTGSPQYRLHARSHDRGEKFSESVFVDIPQPFNGCQGSAILGSDGSVFVSGPDPPPSTSWLQRAANLFGCGVSLTGRTRVTIWKSTDDGRSYPEKRMIDEGLSAQTSLQRHSGQLLLLYEQADPEPLFTTSDVLKHRALENLGVFMPTRFVYREVEE